jgi:hypothetical protein
MNTKKRTIDKILDLEHINSNNIWKKLLYNKEHKNSIYVSASAIRNYLCKDPILDWFKLYDNVDLNNINLRSHNKKNLEFNDNIKESSFLNVLLKKGNEFEQQICDYLWNKFPNSITKINKNGKYGLTFYNFNKTKQSMLNGIPIIEQAVLFNSNNNTFGIADLIVRSDFINKIFTNKILDENEEKIKAPKLNGEYHYVVIDIKWSTLSLCVDCKSLRNEDSIPAYKGQLAIYNCAIGNIQGYFPNKSYILGKAWKLDNKKEGNDPFELLGEINYSNFDFKYLDLTVNAINWIRNVRKNGINWDPLNPINEEMYPNMGNNTDYKWSHKKAKIANNINELTQLWYVGIENRKNAHLQNITSWKDPRCSSEILGINGQVKPKIIDEIIKINRDEDYGLVKPNKIKHDLGNWQKTNVLDFYVDFETTNFMFDRNIGVNIGNIPSDFIFMIGVGYQENDLWQYKVFITDSLSHEDEDINFKKFITFIESKYLEYNREHVPKLYHWTQAELTNIKSFQNRHSYTNIIPQYFSWIDMYKVFTEEPIVVKGALNFKLKTIGKALYNNALIDVNWKNNGVADGLDAMILALDYYIDKVNNKNIIDSIVEYNEIDCKIIWSIVTYLRNNHL